MEYKMKLYILEHDARIDASRASLVEGYDMAVLQCKWGYTVVAADDPNIEDYSSCIAIYSMGIGANTVFGYGKVS